jgi:hypothetical protein
MSSFLDARSLMAPNGVMQASTNVIAQALERYQRNRMNQQDRQFAIDRLGLDERRAAAAGEAEVQRRTQDREAQVADIIMRAALGGRGGSGGSKPMDPTDAMRQARAKYEMDKGYLELDPLTGQPKMTPEQAEAIRAIAQQLSSGGQAPGAPEQDPMAIIRAALDKIPASQRAFYEQAAGPGVAAPVAAPVDPAVQKVADIVRGINPQSIAGGLDALLGWGEKPGPGVAAPAPQQGEGGDPRSGGPGGDPVGLFARAGVSGKNLDIDQFMGSTFGAALSYPDRQKAAVVLSTLLRGGRTDEAVEFLRSIQ